MGNYCNENLSMEVKGMDVMFSNKELVEILKGLIDDDNFEDKKYWNLIEESIREHVKNIKGIDVEVTFDPVIEEISNDLDENLCQHT